MLPHPRILIAVIVATLVVAITALTLSLQASASPTRSITPLQTYQGKTAIQWYRINIRHRIERDRARAIAGDAIRETRRLRRALAHVGGRGYDVQYAIRLAAAAYGVSERELHAVASCESGHDPGAQNGRYRGVFQEGPMFEGGPFGRAGFSVWDPLPNVMMAAYTVAREGWNQWECKP